ncbi:secretory phospholipase A2 receptor-like [Notolabrus celidotus]|uniref:secretory phospholipase A2 receptor-like n=1 Tax=Notolabrus celidotus TaxID=1203425 RepID=UPI00148FD57D|nr:secretory phospholipase A2 receptor-like [Notolabrus celidotus]
MTWTEAQTYCREKYTDLATIENTEETDQLHGTVSPLHNSYTWIGLYSKIEWKWSDGYNGSGADYRNWNNIDNDDPEFYSGLQFCVEMEGRGRWYDNTCPKKFTFICYRGTQQDPEFVFVNEKMDWSSAQRYCRENYIDLAIARNDSENQEIHQVHPNQNEVWIGLYRDPNIYWSDGSSSSFQFWADCPNPLGSLSVVCGVANLASSGRWRVLPCDRKFPFVCYSRTPTEMRQVIKLRMKLEDSSVDLNDPAVTANILKELQRRLQDSGVSGVTIKWREQPDGKVFHKEQKAVLEEKQRNPC